MLTFLQSFSVGLQHPCHFASLRSTLGGAYVDVDPVAAEQVSPVAFVVAAVVKVAVAVLSVASGVLAVVPVAAAKAVVALES